MRFMHANKHCFHYICHKMPVRQLGDTDDWAIDKRLPSRDDCVHQRAA